MLVFQLASPYVLTRAGGIVDGGARVEVSTDQGRSWTAVEAKDFTAAVKGRLAVRVRLTFSERLASVALVHGDLKPLQALDVAAARLCVPVLSGHPSTAAQIGVAFLAAPPIKGSPVDVNALPEAQGAGLVPKQPGEASGFTPAKIIPVDITRQIRAVAKQQAAFNGLGIRVVPNRAVDDGYTVRCEVSPSDRIVLQVDVYAE